MVFIELAWRNMAGIFDGSLFGTLVKGILALVGGVIAFVIVTNFQKFLRR